MGLASLETPRCRWAARPTRPGKANQNLRSIDANLKTLELARVQHGVVSRQQLLDAGFSLSLVDRLVANRRLVSLFPGVYGVGHDVVSHRGWWTAALLSAGPGSWLSHSSAAAVWNLTTPRARCEVVRDFYRRDGARRGTARPATERSRLAIHRSRCLPAGDTTTSQGFRVTSVARTLLDMAPSLSESRLRSLLVEAERLRVFDRKALIEISGRGRGWSGVSKLRDALAKWDPALEVTRSVFEERFLAFCRTRGVPPPQVNVLVEGFEVDCLWPSQGLIVELDGFASHSDQGSFHQDRRRDSILGAAGFEVRRITYPQLRDDPDFVIRFALARLANSRSA